MRYSLKMFVVNCSTFIKSVPIPGFQWTLSLCVPARTLALSDGVRDRTRVTSQSTQLGSISPPRRAVLYLDMLS
ncbi:hypothetical protein J6590_037639 [Homalodisca vitripennis]|nr:hypothetical protein J6590_037639 [Homalodisca vitripennis]